MKVSFLRITLQRSLYFCRRPKLRFYRRPFLIWFRWRETAIYLDTGPVVTSQTQNTEAT